MPPEPPRRGLPLGRVTAEPNVATAPHTPVPPPNDTAVTARPPAPDPREPPKAYARPRPMVRAPSVTPQPPPLPASETDEHTLIGPPPVLRTPTEPQTAPIGRPSAPPTPAQWRSLLYKLVGAVVALVAAATVGIEAYTQYVKLKVDVLSAKVTAQEVVTKPLPAAAASADKSADACRDWARARDDYDRQVFAKLGVIIPQQPNAPPVTEIKTRAPVHKGNSVTGAPVLEVLTAPPALP